MKTYKETTDRDAYRQLYIDDTQIKLRPVRDFFRKLRGASGVLPKTFRALSQHPRYRRVEKEITRRGFKRMLDVGCSTGMVPILLGHRLGVSVTGVDISPIHLAKAKALNWVSSVSFHEVFAEDLGQFAPPASFDCILFLELLEHVMNVEEILMAVSPLLAPGGLVLITLPNDEDVHEQSHQHVREFNEEEIRRTFGHFPEFNYEVIPAAPGIYAGGHFVQFTFAKARVSAD
jgi:2-polyprenyl-6-hydroxyphenyl methylase/3-demethylubiquinone-9 3-methyltransferase